MSWGDGRSHRRARYWVLAVLLVLGVMFAPAASAFVGGDDRDGDGVVDGDDLCPDEPGLSDNSGCPINDRDSDGIPDAYDFCPDLAGPEWLQGCPDSDNDSIPDHYDYCPTEYGDYWYGGCPIPDSDGDGVNDPNDWCPNLHGGGDWTGCPPQDSDGDGLVDPTDSCPFEFGDIDNDGCPPPDSDGDGLKDIVDQCVLGPEDFDGFEDQDGCPDAILISTTSVPDGAVAAPYLQFLSASGASSVFWSTKDTLPPGIQLSRFGVLSGTPTQAGPYTFTVTATGDNGDYATQSLTLTVAPAPVCAPPEVVGMGPSGFGGIYVGVDESGVWTVKAAPTTKTLRTFTGLIVLGKGAQVSDAKGVGLEELPWQPGHFRRQRRRHPVPVRHLRRRGRHPVQAVLLRHRQVHPRGRRRSVADEPGADGRQPGAPRREPLHHPAQRHRERPVAT